MSEVDGKLLAHGDTDAAIDFLKHWAPDGHWVLGCDENASLLTRTFSAADEQQARKWIDAHQGKHNIYFSPNQPRRGIFKKASKLDVGLVVTLHVDFDPARGTTDLQRERERILRAIEVYPTKPSVVLDSGGGYWAFWLLAVAQEIPAPSEGAWRAWKLENSKSNAKPTPEDAADLAAYRAVVTRIEAPSRAIAKAFGADHCFNIDRVARLPGTVNVPSEKKIREKGQQRALARVIFADWNLRYPLQSLPKAALDPAPSVRERVAAVTPTGRREPAAWCMKVIADPLSNPDGAHDYDGHRSRAAFAICCELVRCGWADEEIEAVLTDPANGISDHVRKQKPPARYIAKTITKARAQIASIADDESDGVEAEIRRLAGLPPITYDRERTAAAEKLGCRVKTLDDRVEAERAKNAPTGRDSLQGRGLDLPERDPWHEPVEGAVLLDATAAAIRRHIVIDDAARDAVALWCVAVHAFASFGIFPRLFLTAPTKGAGKSTLLDTIESLVPRPLQASSATAAALFRAIPAMQPILLLDEADAWARDNEDVRAVLNSGHKRGASVLRCVGDEHEPRKFDVFAPAALAAIGRLPDTIEDRSIIVPLRRKLPDEAAEPLRSGLADLDNLARRAARWARDNELALSKADPAMPAGFANRAADNWAPLLAVADLAGGGWPARARHAASALTGGEDQSRAVMLLGDIRRIFADTKDNEGAAVDRMSSETLARRLAKLEDRPWPDYRNGHAITKAQLARQLGKFGIASLTRRFTDDRGREFTAKGFCLRDFDDAFARYLPADPAAQSVTTSQANNDGHSGDFSKRHNGHAGAGCDVSESGEKPNSDGHCDGVTDRTSPPLPGLDGVADKERF